MPRPGQWQKVKSVYFCTWFDAVRPRLTAYTSVNGSLFCAICLQRFNSTPTLADNFCPPSQVAALVLFENLSVGSGLRSRLFDQLQRLRNRHSLVFHEVRHQQRNRAVPAEPAVRQRPACIVAKDVRRTVYHIQCRYHFKSTYLLLSGPCQ